MSLFRRRRGDRHRGSSQRNRTGTVAFTARQLPRKVGEWPPSGVQRSEQARTAHEGATTARITDGVPDAASPPPEATEATEATEPAEADATDPSEATSVVLEATLRIHEDRLEDPPARIDMTPSEAMHLGTRGRRPSR